ncbi:MAG: HNH endonuclease [Boseongicola sp.]|nr:HNH endonuclease [Boseongicola sp.]
MRPVAKGQPPQAEYAQYRDALDDLAGQIGLFCSYCEQPIQHVPEVEHVQPKSLEPELERSWENLLLGCKSCNSTKSDKPVDLDRVAMPDRDNTFRGLVFLEGGRIGLAPGLTGTQAELMRHVVGLVRLDRHPDAENKDDQPTDRDKRADLQRDVWDLAHRYRRLVEQPEGDPLICNLIADDLAPAKGFFSVWMTVFRDHPEMLERFIQAFPGTDACSFNDEGQAVLRPGGRL